MFSVRRNCPRRLALAWVHFSFSEHPYSKRKNKKKRPIFTFRSSKSTFGSLWVEKYTQACNNKSACILTIILE